MLLQIMPDTTTNELLTGTEDQPQNKAALRKGIFIKGARANNLQNVDLYIPKNKLVVVTGLSGSGKSSITMDTLFAEGQRRYVESLSAYARQFLVRMQKPDVDYIRGICPAIAIEQKVSTANARSTVGTLTEVYDFLRLLYARIGKTYSPVSGELVKKHEVSDVVDYLLQLPEGSRVQLLSPIPHKYADRLLRQELQLLMQKGYTRVSVNGQLEQIQDWLERDDPRLQQTMASLQEEQIYLLIDRFVMATADEELTKRIADSIQTAFYESEGECLVDTFDGTPRTFNNRFELDGITFLEPSPQLFNFNNSYGACPSCEGFSMVMGIDESKVIPDQSLSVYEGAVACWKGEKFGEWLNYFLEMSHQFDFPVHRPYRDLTAAQRKLLWKGKGEFPGIDGFFKELEEKTYKIQNRITLARFRGRTRCPLCEGSRLRKEAGYVKIDNKSLSNLLDQPVEQLLPWFEQLSLSDFDQQVGRRLLTELINRLRFMCDLGLGYLTLGRLSNTLSGGETQRINLTRTLGSNLTASMYLLDEPSVGLHPRDTARLVKVLKELRDLGNTVIVVEHEEDVIRNADYLVDIGPEAGIHGGKVVFAGPYEHIHTEANESLTAGYMSGRLQIPIPKQRRPVKSFIRIKDARQNNLKNVTVDIPLNTLTVVSGVSGSGKTSLVKDILYPALKQHFGETGQTPGQHAGIEGDLKALHEVELVNQQPIGRSSRSNPVTYVKAYDAIRNLMANQQLAKLRGLKPAHFSFNVDGGRCDSCKGEGENVIEMQFLADVRLQCEECKGKRFKTEILEVSYNGKNIHEILSLSIEEALSFFAGNKDIISKIKPLYDVGLGYVQLGQSSSTLSGGEAQRVKLASFLGREGERQQLLFIFDEPTTGLHFHDVQKLLDALNALVNKGHSVLVVEHNQDVIKAADWVIDLGPEAGEKGGQLVFAGRPEDLAATPESITGKYLRQKF